MKRYNNFWDGIKETIFNIRGRKQLLPAPLQALYDESCRKAYSLGQSRRSGCSELQNEFEKSVDVATLATEEEYEQELAEAKNVTNASISNKRTIQHKKQSKADKRIAKLKRKKKTVKIQHSLIQENEEYNRIAASKEYEDGQYNAPLPGKKSLLEQPPVYLPLMTLAAFGELPFTYAILEHLLPLTFGMLVGISCLIAMMLGISAHYSATAYIQKDWTGLGLGIITAAAVLGTQVYLRINMPSEYHSIMALLNVGLFTGSCLISYKACKNSSRWLTKAALDNQGHKVNQLYVDLKQVKYDGEIATIKQSKTANNKHAEDLKRDQAEQDKVNGRISDITTRITALHKDKVAWKAFGRTGISAAFEKGRKNSAHKFNPSTYRAISILLLSVTITSVGCKPTIYEAMPTHEVMINVDKTQSGIGAMYNDTRSISNKIFNEQYAIKTEQNMWNGLITHITKTGETALPVIVTYKLKAGDSNKFNRIYKTRLEEIDSFIQVVTDAIDSINHLPADERSTNLYRSLCYCTNMMASSRVTGSKRMYVFSDLAEASSIANFARYTSSATFQRDYEDIAQRMNSVCTVDDISSIDLITFICSASDAYASEAILRNYHYWEWYYNRYDVKTVLKSSL